MKQQDAFSYFEKKANASKVTFHELTIYAYDVNNVAIFEGKRAKPTYHLHFKSIEQRENFIAERKAYELKQVEYRQAEQNRYNKEKEGFVAGAILTCSWGYEQTNIDFYVIVSRKGEFVTLQQIASKRVYDNRYGDRGTCTPDETVKIGDPFRKKISKYSAGISIKSYSWARLYDGKPEYFSCYA